MSQAGVLGLLYIYIYSEKRSSSAALFLVSGEPHQEEAKEEGTARAKPSTGFTPRQCQEVLPALDGKGQFTPQCQYTYKKKLCRAKRLRTCIAGDHVDGSMIQLQPWQDDPALPPSEPVPEDQPKAREALFRK